MAKAAAVEGTIVSNTELTVQGIDETDDPDEQPPAERDEPPLGLPATPLAEHVAETYGGITRTAGPLATLPRCPKCKSADLIPIVSPGATVNRECIQCGNKFLLSLKPKRKSRSKAKKSAAKKASKKKPKKAKSTKNKKH